MYINAACEFAKSFNISDLPVKPINTSDIDSITEMSILPPLLQLESFIVCIHARNIFEIEPHLNNEIIHLNEDWKSKASSYVSHLRELVRNAQMRDPLRESIMQRLNELQRQIDSSQTGIESIVNVFLVMTEAMGKGAKNLEPAVRLVERIAGAFYGLRRSQTEPETKQLPPPDTLGLPDLTDKD